MRWKPSSGYAASTETDVEGRFRIEDAATGSGKLLVDGTHRSLEPWSAEVGPGRMLEDLELSAAPCGALLVRLRDDAGRPASGVNIEVDSDHYRSSGTWTDVQGRAWIEGVRPGEVRLLLFEYSSGGPFPNTRILGRKTVQVPPGETLELEYRVR